MSLRVSLEVDPHLILCTAVSNKPMSCRYLDCAIIVILLRASCGLDVRQ